MQICICIIFLKFAMRLATAVATAGAIAAVVLLLVNSFILNATKSLNCSICIVKIIGTVKGLYNSFTVYCNQDTW